MPEGEEARSTEGQALVLQGAVPDLGGMDLMRKSAAGTMPGTFSQ